MKQPVIPVEEKSEPQPQVTRTDAPVLVTGDEVKEETQEEPKNLPDVTRVGDPKDEREEVFKFKNVFIIKNTVRIIDCEI